MINARKHTFSGLIVSRWTRTFFIYLGLALCASTYSNWQPMFLMLASMNALSGYCTEEEAAPCDVQYEKLTQMFNVAGCTAFAMGLVAGTLVDAIGGRPVMLLAIICVYAGYVMLLVSSDSLQLYWPGLILLGCAENLSGFPAFLLRCFWPGWHDTTASINIACQLLSNFIPVIMLEIVNRSDGVKSQVAKECIQGYLGILAVPALLMLVSIPSRKTVTHYMGYHVDSMKGDSSISISSNPDQEVCEYDGSDEYSTVDTEIEGSLILDEPKFFSHAYWSAFGHHLKSSSYIAFTIWYILMVVGMGYYNSKIMQHSGTEVGVFLGYLNPFTALIGPIMGILSDKIGFTPMLFLCNVSIILCYVLTLLKPTGAHYASACFYIITRSFAYTTKYVFIQQAFPKEHFGKLVGVISLLGGLAGMSIVGLIVLPYNTTSTFSVALAVMAAILVFPIVIKMKMRKTAIAL